MRLRLENCYLAHEQYANQASFFFLFLVLLLIWKNTTVTMFSIPFLLSFQIVAALAAPPLLETVNPTLVASNADIGASPLNSTALSETDASAARALSLAGVHSVLPSHASSVLSTPRHATNHPDQSGSYPSF